MDVNLNPDQLLILKNWIVANHGGIFDQTAADALNALASPAYKVYRTEAALSEIMTDSGFNWTRVDNLSVGKARIWDWMFGADPDNSTINPSKPNVRAGINAVWVGTQADLDVRAAVYLRCVRDATVAEKLLKVAGAGTAPDGAGDGPATMGPEGLVTLQNVVDAEGVS